MTYKNGGYTVIIPCLNEEENIGSLVKEIKKDVAANVIVADNGSEDETVCEASDAGADWLINPERGNVAKSIQLGIERAKTERVIIMDGDWSHPPAALKGMAKQLIYHDMVYGRRVVSRDSKFNRLISWAGEAFTTFLAPGVKERMAGFWGGRRSNLLDVSPGSGPKPFLEYLLKSSPSSVSSVPYVFANRRHGVSKFGRRSILSVGVRQLVRLYAYRYRRLLRYGVVGGTGATTYFLSTLAWGIPGAAIAAPSVFIGSFLLHNFWTFAIDKKLRLRSLPNYLWNLGRDNDDGSFDWWEWHSGWPHKKFKRKLGAYIFDLVGGLEPQQKILSVGCGSSPVLNQWGCKKFGLDINPAKIEFFKDHTDAELSVDDITRTDGVAPFRPEEFDAIICNEVVEHFDSKELANVLHKFSVMTKKGGTVIISTPDDDHKGGRLFERFMHGEFHVGMLGKDTLIGLAQVAGLDYIESRNFLWDGIHKFVRA